MCLQAALLPFTGVQGPWLMGSSRNASWSPTSCLLLWSCHACLLWWLKTHCIVLDPFPILMTRPNHSPCLPWQLKWYIRTEASWVCYYAHHRNKLCSWCFQLPKAAITLVHSPLPSTMSGTRMVTFSCNHLFSSYSSAFFNLPLWKTLLTHRSNR